jgi:hypothetical protein
VALIRDYPASGSDAADIQRARDKLEPALITQDYADVRNFHVLCDLLTIAFLVAREWGRRKADEPAVAPKP